MVDWDRVEELRSKGWEWSQIADDSRVGFRPDTTVTHPGRALRALYHRQRARESRREPEPAAPSSKRTAKEREARWSLLRLGYLGAPLVGLWALFAYVAPSPVGLVVPVFPYLLLVLVGVVFVLGYALFRTVDAPRWTTIYRNTVVSGVILGVVVSGLIGLIGVLAFGCPFLPPSSTLHSQPMGWTSGTMAPWQDGAKPVLYFYGSTWCPYCSASSWAIYKALTQFGTVTGERTGYSSSSDVYAGTPEEVLAGIRLTSSSIAWEVSEDTSGVGGTFPGTSSCFQLAYLSAYGGGAIPFVVVNGQFVHAGTSLLNPTTLSSWINSGAGTVNTSVISESGAPWAAVQNATWMVMAILVKATGLSVATLSTMVSPSWSSSTQAGVTRALGTLS